MSLPHPNPKNHRVLTQYGHGNILGVRADRLQQRISSGAGDMGVDLFIEGVPYGQRKPRGDIEGPRRWTQTVKRATKNLPKVRGECHMTVMFVLPSDKYPTDHPYGPDLDNLMKRLLDALNDTIFSEVAGKDGSVVQLAVSKREAVQGERTGATVTIVGRGYRT